MNRIAWALTILVVGILSVMVFVSRSGNSIPRTATLQAPPESTRRSSAMVYPGDTPDTQMILVTDEPGFPTPYWLFDEALAIQKVQELTATSNWITYVAKRTTANRLNDLLTDREDPLPLLEEDISEPQWIVAWENDSLMSTGQLYSALNFQAPRDDDTSGLMGTKAYVVLDEGGNPVTVGFLNYHMGDSSIQEFPPAFQDISDLPSVPGSISN